MFIQIFSEGGNTYQLLSMVDSLSMQLMISASQLTLVLSYTEVMVITSMEDWITTLSFK